MTRSRSAPRLSALLALGASLGLAAAAAAGGVGRTRATEERTSRSVASLVARPTNGASALGVTHSRTVRQRHVHAPDRFHHRPPVSSCAYPTAPSRPTPTGSGPTIVVVGDGNTIVTRDDPSPRRRIVLTQDCGCIRPDRCVHSHRAERGGSALHSRRIATAVPCGCVRPDRCWHSR